MNRQQYLLTKISEECSELSKAALKAQQFGLTSTIPGSDETNLDHLKNEFFDLFAVMEMLNVEFDLGIDIKASRDRLENKRNKVNTYYQHSIHLGHVERPIATAIEIEESN